MRLTHFPPLILFLIAAGLVFGGYQWGRLSAAAEAGPTPSTAIDKTQDPSLRTSSPTSSSIATQPEGLNFGLFWEAWSKIHGRYLRPVDDSQLSEGAIEGMVESVGDPYTVYLNPDAAKELTDGLQGKLSGIGAEIGIKDGKLRIIAPLPESPAEKAGLKPQDEIQAIDGQPVTNLTLTEAVKKIRGEKGTTVSLTILRAGFATSKELVVTRDEITVQSVEHSIKEGTIGYLKVTGFHDDTTDLAAQALEEFKTAKVKGLILDLRGNPGGLLSESVSFVSLLLNNGAVVKQKSRNGAEQVLSTNRAAILPNTPLVILINGGSASASEIVAGALQDHKRAKLIGETTFGKGTVQELEDLSNGGQVKVTIAEWLTPQGRQINEVGIKPDIEVSLTDQDSAADRDPQLDRALKEFR